MPYIEPSVEQSQSRTLGAWQRRDHVVDIWALRMRSGEPIANLVLGIETRKHDDAVDMLPPLSQSGLQCQFISHLDEAHNLMRSVLFDRGGEARRRGGREMAKADIGEERSLREIDTKDHREHGARRVD